MARSPETTASASTSQIGEGAGATPLCHDLYYHLEDGVPVLDVEAHADSV